MRDRFRCRNTDWTGTIIAMAVFRSNKVKAPVTGGSCLIYGCIISAILIAIVAFLIVVMLRIGINRAIDGFTSTKPLPIPTVSELNLEGEQLSTKFQQILNHTSSESLELDSRQL